MGSLRDYCAVALGTWKVVFKKHSFFQQILMILQRTRITLASIWGHLGVTLESFLVYGGALEPYLRQFDVEKHEMASVMGIYAGLVGPKSENVEKVLVFKAFFEGQRSHEAARESLQLSEPEDFLVTLGSIFGIGRCFWITLGSLRDYCAVALGT